MGRLMLNVRRHGRHIPSTSIAYMNSLMTVDTPHGKNEPSENV